MKKFATRILALAVVLSLLLVPTAMAAERNAAYLSIGNFEITVGEQTLSLPVTLQIGGGVDLQGARGYVTADVATETATAISVLGALENGEVKAYLNGMNYGLSIPLEQIVTLIEEEMGMSLEEAMAEAMGSIDAESMSAITGLMESASALEGLEIDPEAFMAALGITLTQKPGGEEQTTVSLFDVETAATEIAFEMKSQTCKEMFDALAALDPALADYITQYFAMMNESLTASGEEMTIEEALAMITMGANGTIYDAGETGSLADLSMTVAVEGETLDVPMNFVTLTDEAGTYAQFAMLMEPDGESVYFEVYADDYAAEGVDYANISLSAAVGSADSEESETEMVLSFSKQDSAEGASVGAQLYADTNGELVNLGFVYMGEPAVYTKESDSYPGLIYVYGEADGAAFEATAGTNLTLTNVPEGELLSLGESSVNPLEADEETLNQIMTDAQNALIQGLGVLMQDPALASIIGSMMG